MRVFFIREITTNAWPMLSYGMGIVATVASRAGHEVKVLDNCATYKFYQPDEIVRLVKDFAPDAVAFSMTLLNAHPTYVVLAKLRAALLDCFYIAGGIHMRHSSHEALEHGMDMVVCRDGEVVITNLLEHLQDKNANNFKDGLQQVEGVAFRGDDGVIHDPTSFPRMENIDDIPFVDYDLFNLDDYFKTKKEPGVIQICGQWGCPFKCTFCADEVQLADRRFASGDYMFRYVEYLYTKYNQRYIVLSDNNFTYPRKRAMDFFQRIVDSPLYGKVKFSVQTKVETPLDEDLVALMKRAGVVSVGLGLERMDPESQKLIQKVTNRDKVVERMELINRHGLIPLVFLILGFPFETKESLANEKKEFLSLSPYTSHFMVSILQPMPGTIYYDDYPKSKNWYLNGDMHKLWSAYYTVVFHTYMINQADANFFDLDDAIVNQIKDDYVFFKNLDHAYFLKGKKSLFLSFALMMDKLLAHFSKLIFNISPKLEFMIFSRIKAIRYYVGTKMYGDKVF